MAYYEPDERARHLAMMLLYAAMSSSELLGPCENSPCVMNNGDGVEEESAATLVLCPCCVRSLQAQGVAADRSAVETLRALRDAMADPSDSPPSGGVHRGGGSSTAFAGELKLLQSWLDLR